MYYYQIQMQMEVCQTDANVPADSINPADVVNVTEDNDFVNPTANSHREPSGTTDTSDSEVELWCYYRQDKNFDYFIGYDNNHCTIKWFHLSCVNMKMEKFLMETGFVWTVPKLIDDSDIV